MPVEPGQEDIYNDLMIMWEVNITKGNQREDKEIFLPTVKKIDNGSWKVNQILKIPILYVCSVAVWKRDR